MGADRKFPMRTIPSTECFSPPGASPLGKLFNLPLRGRCRPQAADEARYAEPMWRKFGRIRISIGSPERGAGPAIAGSEGSGFSSEKPPPQAEHRPGSLKSLVFAPTAQGLAHGQAGPLSQLRCQLCSALRVRKPQAATASIPFRGAKGSSYFFEKIKKIRADNR